MSYATIDDLRSQLGTRPKAPGAEQAYADKMLHRVPDAPVVDRSAFILEHCTGKRVLEFGASGPMHEAMVKVAAQCYGIDRSDGPGVLGFDLDAVRLNGDMALVDLPQYADIDVIVCGEVLEHLSNPGWFLERLHRQYPKTPTIITVPNAYSHAGHVHMGKGVENVNADHCSWYSFRTLRTLLERYGYAGYRFAWYGGQPLTAEGIVVFCEAPS